MRNIIMIILLLSLNACHLFKENGIEFTIENKSDSPIEKVKFSTSEKLAFMKFDKIEPNQSIVDFLSMTNNKNDGSYTLEFTRANGIKESKRFGYYTNGGSLDRWVEFKIKNDTITRKFSGPEY
ncbi:MAG: hypothetical protein WA775_02655 [Psychroserpens sp.]|uniref:hypothetical protein n=1 Tax=Psychroserpens sp. TaxID=2020870 RepID=UPI003C76E3CC